MQRNTPMQVSYDDERVQYFAEQVSKEGFVPATNASIKADAGKATLISAKPSKEYPVAVIVAALKLAHYKPVTEVRISPKTKQAERTNEEVKQLLAEAQRAIDTKLILKVGTENINIDKDTISGWLDFPEDPATMKLQFGLKQEAVQKYLNTIQGKIYKAPGITRVQIIDGREASRTVGAAGQGIDTSRTLSLLLETLKKGQEATLSVPIAVLQPTVAYDRSYSNTDAGLTALLNDIGGSKNLGIAVMELGGRSGRLNGGKQFEAASTYKLFVAYAVFKEIEAGRMKWSDTVAGRTVEACFEVMIVRSDNPCGKGLGDKIGWQTIENSMRDLGLSQTDLSPSLRTTASDLALFLYKLENGSLLSAPDKDRLVSAMKRQIYRAGIPAGTGVTVANKPGFIGSYIHDPAIVYGPKGPYILVIMTSGSSWSAIADAAKQIHAFLNR